MLWVLIRRGSMRYFSVVGTHKSGSVRRFKWVPITYVFYWEKRKIFTWYPLLSRPLYFCRQNRSLLTCRQNRSLLACRQNRSLLACRQVRSLLACRQNRSLLACRQDRSLLACRQDRSLLACRQNRSLLAFRQNRSLLACRKNRSLLACRKNSSLLARCGLQASYAVLRQSFNICFDSFSLADFQENSNTNYPDGRWEYAGRIFISLYSKPLYRKPLLQRQHLFPKLLRLKRICCCKEPLTT